MIRRFLCWALDHEWRARRVNQRRNENLFHLYTMAGVFATCDRCGAVHNDLPDHDGPMISYPKASALPRATVRR